MRSKELLVEVRDLQDVRAAGRRKKGRNMRTSAGKNFRVRHMPKLSA